MRRWLKLGQVARLERTEVSLKHQLGSQVTDRSSPPRRVDNPPEQAARLPLANDDAFINNEREGAWGQLIVFTEILVDVST